MPFSTIFKLYPNNDLQKPHRKLKIEQHDPHKKLGVNPGAPNGK
jgi:hypothetical protein